MRVRGAVAVLLVGITGSTLVGCGSSEVTAPVPRSSASLANTACLTPSTTTALPSDVPASIPVPPGATVISDQMQGSGLRVVRFRTPTSLRQGILFVLSAFPRAGYVLARGDAEATEADAPFASQDGSLRGALRLTVTSTSACATTWILAFTKTSLLAGQAVIPTFRPTSTASPRPFG